MQIADVYIASRTLDLAAANALWRVADGLDAADDLAVAAYWICAEAPPALRTCHHLHGGMGVDVTYPLVRYFSWITDIVHALDVPPDAVAIEDPTTKNLELTAAQRALKAELRTYFSGLADHNEHREMGLDRHGEVYQRVVRQMGADGWMGVGWPKEYGGHGLGEIEQTIFANEAQYSDVHLPAVTLQTVGPTLIRYGTDEAEGAVPAADPGRRRALRDRLLRAGRRHRPRLAADDGQAGRRPLRRQRPEDVDHRRPPGRLRVAGGAHRHRRPQAQGHLDPHRRHQGPRLLVHADHHRRQLATTSTRRTTTTCGCRSTCWSARRTRAGS